MKLEKRKPTGREKDQANIKLLEILREQLYGSNISILRQSAFHLSWMQEDGLEILKEALFNDTSRKTKHAAAYGLRKMRGRMKKIAVQALKEGIKNSDLSTAEICKNSILIMERYPSAKVKKSSNKKRKPAKFEIRDIPKNHKRQGHFSGQSKRSRYNSKRR